MKIIVLGKDGINRIPDASKNAGMSVIKVIPIKCYEYFLAKPDWKYNSWDLALKG